MLKAELRKFTMSSISYILCIMQKQLITGNRVWIILLSVFFILNLPQKTYAMTDEELEAKFREMEKKIEQQQILIEEQNRTIQTLKSEFNNRGVKTENITKPDDTINREEVKKMVAQLMDEKLPVPEWLSGLKFAGDFRLRYEGIINRADNDGRHRGRLRLRLQIAKKLCDELDIIVRLASASGPSITSTNQSFDDAFSEKDLWIDRAYMVYKPNFLPGLELAGGKLKKPSHSYRHYVGL